MAGQEDDQQVDTIQNDDVEQEIRSVRLIRRKQRNSIKILGLALILLAIVLCYQTFYAGPKRDQAISALAAGNQELSSQFRYCAKLSAKEREKQSYCAAPKATIAASITNNPVVQVTRAETQISNAQIQRALVQYCANNTCKGAQGSTPNQQVVAKAVATYCDSHGKCEGKKGDNATPEQVAAAVSSFCESNNGCIGPSGSPGIPGVDGTSGTSGTNGTDGKDGKDAPTITNINCTDNGKFKFSLSDGTSYTVGDPGTCSNSPAPTATVTDTVTPSSSSTGGILP